MGRKKKIKLSTEKIISHIILDPLFRIVSYPLNTPEEISTAITETSNQFDNLIQSTPIPQIHYKLSLWGILPEEKPAQNFPLLGKHENTYIIVKTKENFEYYRNYFEDYQFFPLVKIRELDLSQETILEDYPKDSKSLLYEDVNDLLVDSLKEKINLLEKALPKIKNFLQSYGFSKIKSNKSNFFSKILTYLKLNKTQRYFDPLFDSYLFLNPKAKYGIILGIYYTHDPAETSFFAKIIDARQQKELSELYDISDVFEDEIEYFERFIRAEKFTYIADLLKWIKEQILLFKKEDWGSTKNLESIGEIYDPYREKSFILSKSPEMKNYIATSIYEGLRSSAPSFGFKFQEGEIDAHSHPYYGDYFEQYGYNYPSLADVKEFIEAIAKQIGQEFAIVSPSSIIILKYTGNIQDTTYLNLILEHLEDLDQNDLAAKKFGDPFKNVDLKGLVRILKKIGFDIRIEPSPYQFQTTIRLERQELKQAHQYLKTILKDLTEEATDPNSDLGYYLRNKEKLRQEISIDDKLIKTKFDKIFEQIEIKLEKLKEKKLSIEQKIEHFKFPKSKFLAFFINKEKWTQDLQQLLEEDDQLTEEIYQLEKEFAQFLHTGKIGSIIQHLYLLSDQLNDL